MKKIFGSIFTVIGLFGLIYFSYQYFQESESAEIFRTEIVIHSGDYAPLLISAMVLGAGIVISKINFR